MYKSSTVLWSRIKEDEGRVALREFFHVSDGITLINKQSSYCDFFHFSIKNKGIPVYQYYADWLEVLQKFSMYFIEQGADLVKESSKNKILLNNSSEQQKKAASLLNNSSPWVDKRIYANMKLQAFRSIGYDHKLKSLSHKECLVCAWLIYGKTSEETGLILGLSRRTVEAHVNNVKKKLNCTKQTQLVYQLTILGFKPNDYIA